LCWRAPLIMMFFILRAVQIGAGIYRSEDWGW
jgi:hypothetical protein